MKTTTKVIRDAVMGAERIAVITHIGPDGDALGSLTAVGLYLRSLGKSATLFCESSISRRFDFLPLINNVRQDVPADAEYDLIIAVDCGDAERMGQPFTDIPDPKPFIINIDHHISNTKFGDVNVVGKTAVSATEVLFEIFNELEVTFTAELATSLLTGLVTDTLAFRTVGVTGNTLKMAGALVDAGGDLSVITMQTMMLKKPSTLPLWKTGINKAKFVDGVYWTSISKKERKKANHHALSSDGLVNFLSNLEDAALGVVLVEADSGMIHVSFRCRPPFNVSEIALNLGGGGHVLAAGCKLPGPLVKAEKLVVEMSRDAVLQQMQD